MKHWFWIVLKYLSKFTYLTNGTLWDYVVFWIWERNYKFNWLINCMHIIIIFIKYYLLKHNTEFWVTAILMWCGLNINTLKSSTVCFLWVVFWNLWKQIIQLPQNWRAIWMYARKSTDAYCSSKEKKVCYILLNYLPSTSPPEEAIFERLKYVVPTTSFLVRRSLKKKMESF